MATLSDINETLLKQNSALDKTVSGIDALTEVFQKQLSKPEKKDQSDQDRVSKLDKLEQTIEERQRRPRAMPTTFREGFMRGSGLTGFGNFIGDFFGSALGDMLAPLLASMLAGSAFIGALKGAAGIAFGKVVPWAILAGTIAAFFGDEIKNFVEHYFDTDGDGYVTVSTMFNKELKLKNGYVVTGVVAAAGILAQLAIGVVLRGVKKLTVGGLMGLAGITGLKSLLNRTRAPAVDLTDDARARATQNATKQGPKTTSAKPSIRTRPPRTSAVTSAPAPDNFDVRTGRFRDSVTGRFKSVDEATAAIRAKDAAKAARYTRILKLARYAGMLGLALDFMDPLMAIYNGEPDSVIKQQLMGTLGSVSGATLGALAGAAGSTLIPVWGQSGFGNAVSAVAGGVAGGLAGEYTAESLASWLMDPNSSWPSPAKTSIDAETLRSSPSTEGEAGRTAMAQIAREARIAFLDSRGMNRPVQPRASGAVGEQIGTIPGTAAREVTTPQQNIVVQQPPAQQTAPAAQGAGGAFFAPPASPIDILDAVSVYQRRRFFTY